MEAGATTINLPNTVERTRPFAIIQMVEKVKKALPENVIISVWSLDDSLFNFTFSVDSGCPGISLLSYYLNDKSINKDIKFDQ